MGLHWCQGFIDLHRPNAVRILDLPHAVGQLGTVAQAVFGAGTAAASDWLGTQAHALRHGQEAQVLAELTRLAGRPDLRPERQAICLRVLAYLTTRREQIRYQTFANAGYPLGSGCVESANKLVVEVRLKGSGMHWARVNVNPMLALRTLIVNDRWAAAWPALWETLRRQTRARATQRQQPRCAAAAAPRPPARPALSPYAPSIPSPISPPRPKTIINGKPTADHPWRRSSPFHAKR